MDDRLGAGGEELGVVDDVEEAEAEPGGAQEAEQGGDYGVNGDVGHHAHGDAVLVEEVADGHGEIEVEIALGGAHAEEEQELQEEEECVAVPVGEDVAEAAEDLSPVDAVPGDDEEDGADGDYDAEEGRGDGAEELGADELPGADREGVHEVALVAQEALEKALDDKDHGDGEHGHQDGHIDQHGDAGGGLAHGAGAVQTVEGEAVDDRQDQGGGPDKGELLEHGAEIVL